MKKKYFIVIALVMTFSSYSQDQKILRTEPNGVVVYKPIDVETTQGIVKEDFKTNPSRSINDLTVEELNDMLYYLNLKIKSIEQTTENASSLDSYIEERQQVRKRIQTLKT
mgnify:FL=1